jgi:hypothetical protein
MKSLDSIKGGKTMKQLSLLIALAALLALCVAASPAFSQDTSPYLLGIWEAGVYTTTTPITTTYQDITDWQIANPTTKELDVYAVFSSANGQFLACTATSIPPNGVGSLATWWNDDPYAVGTVKFFAFPRNSRKFDPNAVIGGFQGKTHQPKALLIQPVFLLGGNATITKANLKAVTINSYTVGEFTTKIPTNCPWGQGWTGGPL